MAEGGSVGHFCDRDRPHDKLCAYYADGGNVGLEPVPAEDMPGSTAGLEPVPDEDLPDTHGLEPVPDEDLPTDYGSTSQQLITGLEGAAQGFAGPLATLAETKVLGVDPADIAGRAAVNPITHGAAEALGLTGSMMTGVGEGALAANIGEKLVPEVAGNLGGSILKGFITNGLIQGGDEISKGILGTGDPQAPVSAALAHIGAAGLFGGAIGGAGALASKGLAAIAGAKIGEKASNYLLDLATDPALSEKLQSVVSKGAQTVGIGAGAFGAEQFGLPEYVGAYLGKQIGRRLGIALDGPTKKYVLPAVVRVLASGSSSGLLDAIDYASNVSSGAQKMNRALTSLFQTGSQQIVDEASDRDHEKIKNFFSDGAINQQIQNPIGQDTTPALYAEGGEVAPAPVVAPALQGTESMSKHFPTQNMLLQAAKGRVNNYLNGLRPQENQARLPFDKPMKSADVERKYDKAVKIAAQPLSILNHVAQGTLTPEALGHFTGMFPEIHGELSKRMTQKITELQAKDESVPYRLRQSLSLFLGSPLDSTLTPQAMQAAQAVYAQSPGQPSAPPVTKSKRNTSKLGDVATDAYTSSQAAVKRQATVRP